MWILKNSNGKYVAPAGLHNSFTRDALKARRFRAVDEARANACGNESVIDLRDLLE